MASNTPLEPPSPSGGPSEMESRLGIELIRGYGDTSKRDTRWDDYSSTDLFDEEYCF
jgi:hypothetical protein